MNKERNRKDRKEMKKTVTCRGCVAKQKKIVKLQEKVSKMQRELDDAVIMLDDVRKSSGIMQASYDEKIRGMHVNKGILDAMIATHDHFGRFTKGQKDSFRDLFKLTEKIMFDLEKRNALLMRVINGFVKFTSGRVKWCPLCGEVDYAELNAPKVLICKKCLNKKC